MAARKDPDKTFAEKVLIAIGFTVLAFLLLALIYFTFDIILSIFAAVMIAILLRGLAGLLGRFIPIRKSFLVGIVFVLMFLVIAGAVALLAPNVADEASNLREELPRSVAAARDYVLQFSWGRTLIDRLPSLDDVFNMAASSRLLGQVGGAFSTTVGAVGSFFVVLLLAVYFALEPEFYVNGFARLFPIDVRPRVIEILDRIGTTLGWWMIGKAASMLFIGTLTWIALSILGVPLALILGLLAGLLSFIPNFGPIASALPAILIAFVHSPISAVYVAAVYVGVQLIESNLVTPLIERETVDVPPGLTIVAQLALAVLVGGLGLVLATPLLAVVMVLVEMIYIQGVLGDVEGSGKPEPEAA